MVWFWLGMVLSVLLALDAAYNKRVKTLTFFLVVDVLGLMFLGYNEDQTVVAALVGALDLFLLLLVRMRTN